VFSYIYFYGHTPWDAPLLPHKLLLDIICLCKHYMPLPGLHYLYIPYPYTTFFLMPVVFCLQLCPHDDGKAFAVHRYSQLCKTFGCGPIHASHPYTQLLIVA
jgi:hypothetical protein